MASTSETTAEAATSRLARVRQLLARSGAKVRQRPRVSLAMGGCATALIGFALAWAAWGRGEPAEEQPLTIDDALAELRAGNLAEARHMAAKLRKEDRLAYDDRGGPAYIQGAALAREAANSPYPDEQRKLYLLAARYLDSAYRQDFPAATSVEGLSMLGQCWHDAGRYARALPVLKQALQRRPRQSTTLHRLLASAYYRDANPQLQPALTHIQKYLADRMLSPAERHAGVLEQARMLLDAGQAAEAAGLIDQIAEDSELASAVGVMRARMLMLEASTAEKDEALALWNQAIEQLRKPPGRDEASLEAQRAAQYLLGLCYLKIEDFRAAENQFSRSRRISLGTPEGIASTLEEADLQRLQGKDEAAIELYRTLMRDLGSPGDYSNPWLSSDELMSRLMAAYRHYRDAEKFAVALEFVDSLEPLLSEPKRLELKGEVCRRWGERIEAEADATGESRAGTLLKVAFEKYHNAAEHYYRLARISLGSREYPNYLWASAECYRLAHDFHRTTRVMRMYLMESQQQRRADALLAIGEAELALGSLETSIAALEEMLRNDPKHPLSYRARIVAHQALLEQDRFDEARELLLENLEHESLTPQSLEWRDSLFAMGRMQYRRGMELEAESRRVGVDREEPEPKRAGLKLLEQAAATFQEAILRLEEAMQRYPDAPQAVEARYTLADAYRQSAKLPRKKIPTVSIETTRNALTRKMNEDLTAAHQLYSKLIELLNERQDQRPLIDREREILRNCYFLLADCLFDMARYEDAIQAYSSASNRYQNRPEALEAFVQIASCYRQLDQPSKARGTLEQAKVMLRRIPEDVSFDKTTRYSRDEWVSLLDFLGTL